MNEVTQIVEAFSLAKFKKLVKLILDTRVETDSVVRNNKNGYFRTTDENGNLHVCRSLSDQAPERAKEIEQALIDLIYRSKSGGLEKSFFKERKMLSHEISKDSHLATVFAINFKNRFFACGGLQAHENVALVMLFLCFAIEENFSPLTVPQTYIDDYSKMYLSILEVSEQNSTEGTYCKKALELVDKINKEKRTVWPSIDQLRANQS